MSEKLVAWQSNLLVVDNQTTLLSPVECKLFFCKIWQPLPACVCLIHLELLCVALSNLALS